MNPSRNLHRQLDASVSQPVGSSAAKTRRRTRTHAGARLDWLQRPREAEHIPDPMNRSGSQGRSHGLANTVAAVLPPPSATERLARFLRTASVLGFLFSAAAHLLLWIIAVVVHLQVAQAGGGGEGGGPIDVAIISSVELEAIEEAGLGSDIPGAPEITLPDLPGVDSLDTPSGDEFAGALDEGLGDIGALAGSGNISGGDGGLGGGGAGGGGSAKFFGVEARGTRFAYIVDVSGSMSVGGKLDALKGELSRSVESLDDNFKFFVCLFSSSAQPLGSRHGWTEASESGKRWARRAVAELGAGGGTVPGSAFQLVFALSPRPDAIYFMTDGEFNPEVAFEIARMNADARVPIHCISFVSREAEELLRKIASDSGGTYTHVEGPSK